MEYRTEEQFNEITENMVNGNWTDAGELCAKSGFYANDLRVFQEAAKEQGTNMVTDDFDFVELIEIATKYR